MAEAALSAYPVRFARALVLLQSSSVECARSGKLDEATDVYESQSLDHAAGPASRLLS